MFSLTRFAGCWKNEKYSIWDDSIDMDIEIKWDNTAYPLFSAEVVKLVQTPDSNCTIQISIGVSYKISTFIIRWTDIYIIFISLQIEFKIYFEYVFVI